jgi:hypothetical protein
VNALANEEVGKYFRDHFVSSFQKVGTFRLVNGTKQGGNVASYFALADGSVLHIVAGPVDAATLLREARWVVEARKLAIASSGGDAARYRAFFQKAHAERLQREHGRSVRKLTQGTHYVTLEAFVNQEVARLRNDRQAQVHLLLASYPLVKIDRVYRLVFERILGERVSTLPVLEANEKTTNTDIGLSGGGSG